jgi:hypothetical protein
MLDLLLELIPTALGLALTPTAIAAGILFLSSRDGLRKGVAFAAPFVLIYSLIALVVLVTAAQDDEPLLDHTTKHVILLIVGLVILAVGVRLFLQRKRQGLTVPGWMRRIDTVGPKAAFGLGVAVASLTRICRSFSAA